MSFFATVDETASYRKIIDKAIVKLKKLLHKHHQRTQMFWYDYNDDDEITDDDSKMRMKLVRKSFVKLIMMNEMQQQDY
jgi:hypothetical protein